MKLARYLKDHGLTASAFAAEVGVPPSTITRLLKEERSPRLELLAKISVATNGEVRPEDFLPTTNGKAA